MSPAPSSASPALPPSYGGWLDPLASVAVALASYALFRHRDISDVELAIVIVGAIAGVMSGVEYVRVNRGVARPRQSWRQVAAGALGQWLEAMIGFAFVVFCWWLLQAEYGRPEYQPLWAGLVRVAPYLPVAVLAVVGFTEWRLGPLSAGRAPLARALLTRGREIDVAGIRQALLALLVRAIFLPLNFCVLVRCIEHFRGREAYFLSAPWPALHAAVLVAIYGVLIAAIVPGYLFSSRLIATHVRETDATLLGWVVTLACYRPLTLAVFDRWLHYQGQQASATADRPWVELSIGSPALFVAIGIGIILVELVHLWAEASFGLRASNLTNRGVITIGPYRFCKHPIYLSKCVGWLLIFMPFVGGGIADSLRATLLFAGVCWLYAARAWVEERLMARDPDYVAYALWMDEHGLFSWVGRMWPAASFRFRLTGWQAYCSKNSQENEI